jgi:predicted aldo/keto reductase-like oxidoreductase
LDDIPGNINVGRIVQLRNLCRAFDLVEYGQMRYNLLGQAADWFPGQNSSPGNLTKVRPQLENLFKTLPAGHLLMSALEEGHELLYKAPEKRLSDS